MKDIKDRFDPVSFSLQECQWLIDHLGEPSYQALQSIKPVQQFDSSGKDKNPIGYPDGVIPGRVKPIIDRVYELNDLESKGLIKWVGIGALKTALKIYIREQNKWMSDKKRFPSAPRFPSMHSYDGKNRPHRGGPGSDSGRVQTYFDREGNRLPFAIDMLDDKHAGQWTPEWAEVPGEVKAAPVIPLIATKKLFVDPEHNRIECQICHHTESFKGESRASYNAARGRMSKHLRTDTKEVDLHRELYTNEFGA